MTDSASKTQLLKQYEQIEKHTALAVQLIDYFEHRLQREAPIWYDATPVKRVANSCQIIEAFYHLNLPNWQITLEPALEWLRRIPISRELSADDARSVRLFPSRFKTFALLRDFEGEFLARDFQDLATHFIPGQAMLTGLPSGMHNELATLIWVDTLLHLEQDGWSIAKYRTRLTQALNGVKRAFHEWLAGKTRNHSTRSNNRLHFHDDGDASYGLDLLLTTGALKRRPQARTLARAKLIEIVRQSKTIDVRNHAPLYCAIQLAAHFDDPEARQAVYESLNRLNEWFETHWSQDLPLDLAALTLRLIAHTYGDALRAQIFQLNWSYRQANERTHKDAVDQQQQRELERILRSTFQIHVGDREIISGTRSENQIVRVRFGFRTEATTERGDHAWQDKTALRLIIKQGSVESLRRAIASYNALDPEIRRYFAQHTSSIPPLSDDPNAPWYLVMEDLGKSNGQLK